MVFPLNKMKKLPVNIPAAPEIDLCRQTKKILLPALSFCLRDSALRPCTFGTRLNGILQSLLRFQSLVDSESIIGFCTLNCEMIVA